MDRLIAKARRDHSEVTSELCISFSRALDERAHAVTTSLPAQRETFRRFVLPFLEEKRKTAYVLVDGMRYEMADEFVRGLHDDEEAELEPTLEATFGTLPSITDIGMAALVPGADKGAILVAKGGKAVLEVSGQPLSNLSERVAYIDASVDGNFERLRLSDLLPVTQKARQAIKHSELLCITATEEIDGLCEEGNVAMARRLMDDVLLQLRRAAGNLVKLGVERIVITADHGYLFGEALGEDSKLDPPGGETVSLHRRSWVGKGGTASDHYLRLKSQDVGLGGDLEIVVPRGIAVFKVRGGAGAYLHGGASIQELLIPVVTMKPKTAARGASDSSQWSIQLGSKTISAQFVSVTIDASTTELFAPNPLVRVELRDQDEVVSVPVAASYGFDDATGFVRLKAREDQKGTESNTVTLMLKSRPEAESLKVMLIDAHTDRVLARLEGVPVTMADY